MIALLQRVTKGSVAVHEKTVGSIDRGFVVLLGITRSDTEADINPLVDKIINLRVFPNGEKEFDVSVQDIKGSLLVISQFTLAGNCKKGRRPSFDDAAPPEEAKKLYDLFVEKLRTAGIHTETGEFQAYMQVEIHNDGPVTFILESGKLS